MMKPACRIVVTAWLTSGLSHPSAVASEPPTQTTKVSYANQIEPIFRTNCQGCHQPAKALGDFMLTEFSHLLAAGESGQTAIVPGEPDQSYLVDQITPVDGVAEMPKKGRALSEIEIDLVRRWIAEGAINDSTAKSEEPEFSKDRPPVYSRPPLINALEYSLDGKWLAISGFHEVLLVNATSHELKHRLVGLSERIESLSFSHDSRKLAVTGGSPGRLGEVQVWDVETGTLSVSRQITFDTIFGGRFSPDGKLIAFGCTDNTVRAIDSETGEQKLHQGAHSDWVQACVFSPDGSHLISAGRDMTVKLTEVETERFVDNITSITPGALRGGINALVMHPERNETLVGGADGVPKVYRLFRETERKIGDDANLIRSFPAMQGRIFAISIGPAGKHFAVASTLDGHSHVAVYPYDFDGNLPDDVKAAMGKRIADRTGEESKLINEYTSRTSEALHTMELPTSLYAVAFSSDGQRLALGGGDGLVRVMHIENGRIETEFCPVPLHENGVNKTSSGQPVAGSGLQPASLASPDRDAEQRQLPSGRIVELMVEPQSIELSNRNDYAQLIVTAVYSDGQTWDVTRLAEISSGDQVSVSSTGLVRLNTSDQLADASKASTTTPASVQVQLQGAMATIPVAFGDPHSDHQLGNTPTDFVRDVNPLLSRLGCNSGTCHGAQKGKNGFKLSLRGYDPLEDIRALSDDLASRRLNTAVPEASLMLLKPLGRVPHEGGVLLTRDSVYYKTLRDWIADGAQLDRTSQKVSRIELSPAKPVIERENSWQQFRVVAYFPDGSSRDVTHEAFIETGNAEVCKSFDGGRVQAIRRGEAPILARYEGAYAAATITVMGDRTSFAWQQPETYNRIDELVSEKWERMKIAPSELCGDAEFLRRIRLDLTGLPPEVDELRAFLDNPLPSRLKRSQKVDELVGSVDYVEHWTNKWADLLQVNSKFIGNEGAKQFRDWIRAAVSENRPYDQFASELLTASGTNRENPAASYYKILRDPDLIMENTTHLFLAIRFNCNKCHDHPFERWTQDQYYQLSAFFARTGLKADPEAGDKKIGGSAVEGAKPLYEVVFDKDEGEMLHVRTNEPVAPQFPYACDFEAAEGATRREQLAAWITSADNPYFAKSFVNRLWGYLTGHGLMMPLDDIRAGNPPTNPELLEHLTEEFIRSDFDVEHVMRLICNSRTYQLSVATNDWNRDDEHNYSHATARRLPAEVLYDAVHRVTGAISTIPGVPPGTRAASLPDVAVSLPDGFLNNLGRPVRESACECERSQELQLGPVMALVSGPTIGQAISDPSCALPSLAQRAELSEEQMIQEIYLRVLSRRANQEEIEAIKQSADAIAVDDRQLQQLLVEREQEWTEEKSRREKRRLLRLEEMQNSIAEREVEIAPAREQAEATRLEQIAASEKSLAEYAQTGPKLANEFLKQHKSQAHWFPLAATSLTASNKAELIVQEDRSIVASGSAEKGTYTVSFSTPLTGIRAFRLEALPHEGTPAKGPGLSANGNFVLTEIELDVASVDKPEEKSRVALATGKADFEQEGFSASQVIDGQTRDQRGWAVHPRGGTVHWAVFEAKKPFGFEGGSLLTFTLHQFHNAADHRLARFRISVTTDAGEIGLSLPESFAALQSLPAKRRIAKRLPSLLSYLESSDSRWTELKQKLEVASKPLPPDERLVELKALAKALEIETPDDPRLLQLRRDAEASRQQVANRRLTLAQDLTWALINSPAFLFNH